MKKRFYKNKLLKSLLNGTYNYYKVIIKTIVLSGKKEWRLKISLSF